MIRGVRDRYLGVDESWKELYTWYRQNEGQKVDRILDAGFFKKKPDALTGEEAAELYGEKKQFSVTRMERFSACAYAHFLTYGLHLSDRERYEFEAMDLGNIAPSVHGAVCKKGAGKADAVAETGRGAERCHDRGECGGKYQRLRKYGTLQYCPQ